MAMRRDDGVQDELIAVWSEIPRSPGHAFYDKLQKLLREAGFDAFVEDLCKSYYAAKMGAPSVPMMMRQRPAGSLRLRAKVAASDGYARFDS